MTKTEVFQKIKKWFFMYSFITGFFIFSLGVIIPLELMELEISDDILLYGFFILGIVLGVIFLCVYRIYVFKYQRSILIEPINGDYGKILIKILSEAIYVIFSSAVYMFLLLSIALEYGK